MTKGAILTKEEAKEALIGITEEKYPTAQVTAFLTVYMMRSITAQELDGFREALLEKAVKIDLGTVNAVDLCGTGGDGKDTFNISTIASLVVASAGYKVIKHGNVGVSSSCGSSDVLSACGYTLTADEAILKTQLEESNFCYIHAPLFHPSLKTVGPIRKDLGLKTFFNMIGPLVNPVQPKFQLVGTYDMNVAELYYPILKEHRDTFTIVHSTDGYDEISLTADFHAITRHEAEEISPESLGFSRINPADLTGGNSIDSAKEIFLPVLSGKGTEAQNSAVIMNAATAINTMEGQNDFAGAVEKAKEALLSGKGLEVLNKVIAS